MNLKKCSYCESYTLKEVCEKCNKKTSDAHYKYLKTYPKKDKEKSN